MASYSSPKLISFWLWWANFINKIYKE
jgi:hypothetical protein